MNIYVAGPMTGLPDWNRAEFEKAELELSDQNHTVLNPARHIPLCNPDAIPHSAYMLISLAMVDCCEAVYMLDGWERSKGARREKEYAERRGLKLMYQTEVGG